MSLMEAKYGPKSKMMSTGQRSGQVLLGARSIVALLQFGGNFGQNKRIHHVSSDSMAGRFQTESLLCLILCPLAVTIACKSEKAYAFCKPMGFSDSSSHGTIGGEVS
jgi:hypothetical protein